MCCVVQTWDQQQVNSSMNFLYEHSRTSTLPTYIKSYSNSTENHNDVEIPPDRAISGSPSKLPSLPSISGFLQPNASFPAANRRPRPILLICSPGNVKGSYSTDMADSHMITYLMRKDDLL